MVNSKKLKELSLQEKTVVLQKYYQNKQLTIMGLNDSQGVNLTKTFYKKGIIHNVAYKIKKDATVLDLSSLTMNKTEHINYFLDGNISLEQVKLSQQYSAVEAAKKALRDFHLPSVFGNAANIYKINYHVEPGDDRIFVTNALANAKDSIVIYSSGVNNLMRSVGNNPFRIRYDYKTRSRRPNFDYTLKKTANSNVLNDVLSQVEDNLYKLKSINPNSIIMVLNAPCPTTFDSPALLPFKTLISNYNQGLKEIAEKLDLNIINIEDMSPKVFHFDQQGNNEVVNVIIETLYHELIHDQKEKNTEYLNKYKNIPNNIDTIIASLYDDYDKVIDQSKNLSGYDKKRELQIAKEHETEIKIMKKVKAKTKKHM